MKVYITGRFQGETARSKIEGLSKAVQKAHMRDFCFVRDVEAHMGKSENAAARWARKYDELGACDAMLIDIADMPPGEVLIESGMAYAMRKPVIVVVKRGVHYKGLFEGVSATVIEYDHYKDITSPLKKYDHDRTFTLTDKTMLFAVLLVAGGASSWALAQLFLPLAPLWALVYWLVIRQLFTAMRDFDRIVIYIPLAALWLGGIALLQQAPLALVWAWIIGFWLLAFAALQRLKFLL